MTEEMSLKQMATQAGEDSNLWFPDTANDPFFMAAAMSGEAGECVNVIKKAVRDRRPLTVIEKHNAVMEATDVFTYFLGLASVLKFDPARAYNQVRAKNIERFK